MKEFFTDGSAVPNPGAGGFAVVSGAAVVALGREKLSTNIRMEAMALLAAYELAGAGDVIYTDSEFWINVLTKWAPVWQKNGWKKKDGAIKNLDLVQKLYTVFKRKSGVELSFTRGHTGTVGNELADEWANKARAGVEL